MRSIQITLMSLALAVCLLLAGCGAGSYATTMTAVEVTDSIREALPSESSWRQTDADYVNRSRFGEQYSTLTEKCTDYVILLAKDTGKSADQIGVFRVREESDVETVAEIVRAYAKKEASQLRTQYEAYAPDQCPKLDAAAVKVCGTYVLCTFLSEADTDTTQKAFAKALEIK